MFIIVSIRMNVYLFPALGLTPTILERTFNQIPKERWDTPTHPGRFTPREVVAHLADWEPVMLARMKQCLESPGSTIVARDEEQMALDNGYSDWNPIEALETFKAARAQSIQWLKSLSQEQFALTGVHSERGVWTIYDQANLLVGHDVYHIDQLSAV